MRMHFDLISDLHVETWPHFDWTGQPTSPYCIVAGDIARDRALVVDTLEHLGSVYKGVFYIDGNAEHKDYITDLGQSYRELSALVNQIPNVVYLQDNVVVIEGVAIVATNGWWSYDFDPALEYEQCVAWVQEVDKVDISTALSIGAVAYTDAAYINNTVSKLQRHSDVKSIVMVSHTVPSPWIVNHDIDLIDTWRFNCMGNSHLAAVLHKDTERKIKTWCFGHYHKPVDRIHDGIRYVNNCRGGGNSEFRQDAYYPKRITVEY